MAKWLYVFKDPMGARDVKVGITSNPRTRLGSYQNGYSAKSHKACFNYIWSGPPRQIDRLESVLKEKFNWDIESNITGESEWISDMTVEDFIPIVNEEIAGWRFHIKPLEANFPLTIEDVGFTIPDNKVVDKSSN